MIHDFEDQVVALLDYLEEQGLDEENSVRVMGAACNALILHPKTAKQFVDTFMKAFHQTLKVKESIHARRNAPH